MTFPRKKQARAWCISLTYRHLIRKEGLKPIIQNNLNIAELAEFFHDEIIFLYKGDIEYFKSIYNSVAYNFLELKDKVLSLIIDERLLPEIFQASLICALAEIECLCIPKDIVVAEYINLMREYGEENPGKIFKKLLVNHVQERL